MKENTLNLWLYLNYVTEDPNDFYGKIKYLTKFNNKDIAQIFVNEGSEFNVDTIYNILERSDKIKANRLARGHTIDTPFCLARAGTSGVYHSATEKFDKETHKLYANYTQGEAVRTELAKVEVDILGEAKSGTIIGKVIDTLTGELNSTITPNNVLRIEGIKLKVAGEKPEVGVWFINTADESRTKVTQIINNEPKELLVMIPALAAGAYELEIVTQYNNNSRYLNEARIARLEHLLTVQ